jgi:2-octaprenyl-6-methoxyphenol hydroxylase
LGRIDDEPPMSAQQFPIAVVGGGPAGLTAAIAVAAAGIDTVLVAGSRSAPDHRTTALLAGSVRALDALGAWSGCRPHAAPLRVLRIIDATSRLVRAPEVAFAADEIGLDAFGYNIDNSLLRAALTRRARELPALRLIEDEAAALEFAATEVGLRLKAGRSLAAQLAIGADGRHSLCRAAAGIAVERRSYPQTALTLNLRHARPHHDTSTELHTERGPFTLVPLPGQRSSLVLVTAPDEAARLAALPDTALAEELERRSHSILGRVAIEPGRSLFPLAVESAARLSGRRLALIGEAAHVMAPIGAQGLNLGLRDAATIAELVVDAHRRGADIGAARLTGRYEHIRRADVASRTLAVDLLNRSLLSEFLPLHATRGMGLFLMQKIGPLRRAVMREGVAPLASQPRLMRGEPL